MIISHKHKFIFIKTEKTAGTSIEIGLSKFCGPDDIITPISPEDETIRKELGYREAQNFEIPFSRYSKKDYLRLLYARKRMCFYNHMNASNIIQYIGREVWGSYFKFCFERNPWDKAISWYFWRCDEPRPNLSDFIQSAEANIIKGFELYTVSSDIVVDKVYHYEKLDEAIEDIRIRLNLSAPITLPNAKSRFRKGSRNYRDLLSTNDKEKIEKVYAREIAFFNYEW